MKKNQLLILLIFTLCCSFAVAVGRFYFSKGGEETQETTTPSSTAAARETTGGGGENEPSSPPPPPPVDCVGSHTDPACPTECGKSASTLTKQWITTTAPKHGGKACPPNASKNCAATTPCPENCEYREKDTYTKCTPIYLTLPPRERLRSTIPMCGDKVGRQYKEIEITKQPKHGGKACPTRGSKRSCDIECKDCKGEFKPVNKGGYSNSWINYRRKWATSRYDVTSPSGPGGKPCKYNDNQYISIIHRPQFARGGVNYDYGGKECGKFVGKSGDSTIDTVFGWKKDIKPIKDFDSNIKSYHKVNSRLWCAIHK